MQPSRLMRAVSFSLAFAVLALSGCKNMDVLLNGGHSSAERRVTNLAGVLDRPLVDAFYQLSEDGETESLPPAFTAEKFMLARLEPSAIYLDKVLHVSLTSSLADIRGRVNQYLPPADTDAPGQAYVAVAKARGNVVKLYKPALNRLISSSMTVPFRPARDGSLQAYFDLDNAMVEYDRNGRIVSFMTRCHNSFQNIGAQWRQYTIVFFGRPNAQYVENHVKNSDFTENYLRDL